MTLRETQYLLSGFAPAGGGSGLQLEYSTQQGKRLVLGKADVGVIVQAEDLWRVVDWQAADVRQVALHVIHDTPQVKSEISRPSSTDMRFLLHVSQPQRVLAFKFGYPTSQKRRKLHLRIYFFHP